MLSSSKFGERSVLAQGALQEQLGKGRAVLLTLELSGIGRAPISKHGLAAELCIMGFLDAFSAPF